MKLFNRIVSAFLTPVLASAIAVTPLVSIETKVNAQVSNKIDSEIVTSARIDRFVSDVVYELSETLKLENENDPKFVDRGIQIIKIWNTVKDVEQIRNYPKSMLINSSIISLERAITALLKFPSNLNSKDLTEYEIYWEKYI